MIGGPPELNERPGHEVPGTVYATNPDVLYIPFVDVERGMVGYCCRSLDGGRETFVYLVPSGDTDCGTPNVFLYAGIEGDPTVDEPECHVPLTELIEEDRA